jgi:glycosyltransferase involved in cell wall biosynthesis
MRIGVVPVASVGGGVYQYSLTVLDALDSWLASGSGDDLVAFGSDPDHHLASLPRSRWTVRPFGPPSLARATALRLNRAVGSGRLRESLQFVRRRLTRRVATSIDDVRVQPAAKKWFDDLGIELMIYPTHDNLSFETRTPYLQAIHDLQHRLHPEFPEVSANGEWERREYTLKNIVRYATLLIADSEIGREDILRFYGDYIGPDRVKVLPFLPASYLNPNVSELEKQRVRMHYQLPERFLFYPAQFWPHKNHLRVVQALGLIRAQHGVDVPIVLCGSNTGELRRRTFKELMTAAQRLKIEKNIYSLGYVSNGGMSALYAEATALVMPTFFGPTNIPPIEAASFGCPVLTADIRGIREQVGDGAVLVDPRSVESIADGIYRLWEDEDLRQSVSEKLRRRLGCYTQDDFRRRLIEIVGEAKEIVQSSKSAGQAMLL